MEFMQQSQKIQTIGHIIEKSQKKEEKETKEKFWERKKERKKEKYRSGKLLTKKELLIL